MAAVHNTHTCLLQFSPAFCTLPPWGPFKCSLHSGKKEVTWHSLSRKWLCAYPGSLPRSLSVTVTVGSGREMVGTSQAWEAGEPNTVLTAAADWLAWKSCTPSPGWTTTLAHFTKCE